MRSSALSIGSEANKRSGVNLSARPRESDNVNVQLSTGGFNVPTAKITTNPRGQHYLQNLYKSLRTSAKALPDAEAHRRVAEMDP
ncbi:MAG: 3'-to-5' exoribonuclease RNase R [uncultured Truepera sp.]|uniref:3'-to-5' exoribonuclease RNase R n=1 Tax=uncultured Truepera sp. TaxID=543023 RepID=A0A6J4VKK0_9DEIN|nr:MAG: 3'-to-5' exoribonuclease RNase R [uncultured Truepera sp.]